MYIAPLLPQVVTNYPELSWELVLTDSLVDLVEDNIDLAHQGTTFSPNVTSVPSQEPRSNRHPSSRRLPVPFGVAMIETD
ncbi:MAG: hypothetical protein JNK92_08050 [Dechloromonas sp.]|nr:hypothetical protein [Dechloromonas sp.]